MKLTAAQIEAVERQTQAKALPDDDEAAISLSQNFGDHTFYLDPNGLYIFEQAQDEEKGQPAALVQIAEWVDETKTSLSPIEPSVRPVVVDLMK